MATEQISDKSGIHFKLSDLENQCGDNCQGECSGEVTGTPFCPQPERDKVLDDYCIIDLTYYVWGEAESDDVRLCQGKGCNYCGRYNAELRQVGSL